MENFILVKGTVNTQIGGGRQPIVQQSSFFLNVDVILVIKDSKIYLKNGDTLVTIDGIKYTNLHLDQKID